MCRPFRSVLITVFSILIFFDAFSQKADTLNFRSPVDFPIYLAANFGELRPNHFHAGIDVKTQQVIGKPLFAIDSGFVSRIQLRPVGYGKAIYITHSCGYTSLYGHIDEFSPRIDSIITAYQHAQHKSQLDISFEPNEIPVFKGEEIAKAGNSGSSGGPHLHFEIRNAITQSALNVQEFYPEITDKSRPQIFSLSAYPLDSLSFVNGQEESKTFIPNKIGEGLYSVSSKIQAKGSVGFAIRANDYMHNVHNVFGIYSMELRCNDSIYLSRKIDSIPFAESYDINSMIDYSLYITDRRYVEKLYVEPNNALSIYNVKNYGIQLDSINKEYMCEVRASDYYGNVSMVSFSIEFDTTQTDTINSVLALLNKPCNEDLFYEADSISIFAEKGSFYKDYSFSVTTDTIKSGRYFSQKYKIESSEYVVKNPVNITIQSRLPDSLRAKGLIQLEPVRGYKRGLLTTIDNNGVAYAESKILGTYSVVIDTISPSISSLNFRDGQNLQNTNTISFKMSDNFSGIAQYMAYIDNQWCILEYDAKYAYVTLNLNKCTLKPNSMHSIAIIVIDQVGNSKEINSSFYR